MTRPLLALLLCASGARCFAPAATSRAPLLEQARARAREADALPPGWQRHIDASTGEPYYSFGGDAASVRWDPPPSPEDGAPRRLDAEPPETARDDPAAAAGACVVLGAAELEVALEDASSPLLVDGYAEWCGPCQLMAPVLDRVARALGARARVVKFDTEESGSTLAGRLAIEGLPTLLFFRPRADGGGLELAHRFEGAAPEEHVLKLVEHHFFGGPAPPAVNLR